jgi:DNA polymerase elongation subunit (family B)
MIRTNAAMKLLTLDIETKAHVVNTWGLFNQNVGINQIEEPTRMISFAAKWTDNNRVAFFSEFHNGRDDMVRAAFELVDEADAVIHYNGKGFDMKHLNREFKELDVRIREGETVGEKLGQPSDYHHIDLLTVVRAKFKLASNKLDYVAREFLRIGGKVKHPGFDLWAACAAGDPRAWALMRRYNKGDVVLTEKVYYELLEWIDNHPNMQLYTGETGTCPTCGSPDRQMRGTRKTKLAEYQTYRCNDCGRRYQDKRALNRAEER